MVNAKRSAGNARKRKMLVVRSAKRKTLAFRAGYRTAQLFDQNGMPLDISIGDVLLIGGIGLLLLMGIYLYA